MRSIVLMVALAACGQGLRDDRFPTGSSTVAMSKGHDVAYAVNVDEGSLTRVSKGGGTREVHVGAQPSRVARVGDELWVTLRGERGVAVVTDDGQALKVDQKLKAGTEPVGIVASEDGRFVYVASSLSDVVTEYDGRSREVLREFPVAGHPTWLALHPSGRALFVGSSLGGRVSRIDLKEGTVTQLDLPEGGRETEDGWVELDPRVSGDPYVSPDGDELAFPVVYADTDTSVDDPEDPEEPVVDGYGGSSAGIGLGRINPVLVVQDLDAAGVPTGKPVGVFLATQPFDVSDSSSDTDRGGNAPGVLRSYPTSVTGSPSSNEWVVTMEASNALVVVSARDESGPGKDVSVDFASTSTDCSGDCGDFVPFTSAERGGFVTWNAVAVTTARGPKGVAFDEQEHAVVHTWLDRQLEAVEYSEVDAMLEDLARNEFRGTLTSARPLASLAKSALPDDVEAGRKLFFSAVDERMAASGAGVSCSTCHMEGRNDGFTWTLSGEQRNTPSLAGPVQDTAPVTWSEEVGSVAEEAQLTSELRMGGKGLSAADAALVQAYVNFTPYPDAPERGGALVEQGRQLFEREDVGCASCHGGELYTDTQQHLIRGHQPTQTPTLRGIAASGPYYHDGSATTLEAVVATAKENAMGDTSMLSTDEKKALVAFLRSL